MVQLTIDTEKDSPEQLRKVIQFLESIVGTTPTPMPSYAAVEPSEDMFSMFGNNEVPKQPELKTPESLASYSTSDLLQQADDDDDDDTQEEATDKDFFTLMEY